MKNRIVAVVCWLAFGCEYSDETGSDRANIQVQHSGIINCPIDDPDCPPEPGDSCRNVTQTPPTTQATYYCDLTLTDLLNRPAAGQVATISVGWCNADGVFDQGSATGVTDSTGRVRVTYRGRAGNQLACRVATTNGIRVGTSQSQQAKYLTGKTLTVDATKYPDPTATRAVGGLLAGAGEMVLYQSGAYDRVVLIPEYFDLAENSVTPRDLRKFFTETRSLLTNLSDAGYDIWLFQPFRTGDSLHEQAAELAQAIDIATRQFSPQCAQARVGVLGLNTAGVVARIATARWEADSAWLGSLGIPNRTLPVAFLGSLDAPQYGLNLNVDLQKFISDKVSAYDIHTKYNLDSCALNQLIRQVRKVTYQWGPNNTFVAVPFLDSSQFKAFFVDGTPVSFYSGFTGGTVTCAGGPAVAFLNGARGVPGWPVSPRRFGVSFGSSGDSNRCYGDETDRNAAGNDLCKFRTDLSSAVPFVPRTGDSWIRFDVNNWFDRYADARAEDLVPGSRSPFFIHGMVRSGFFDTTARQRFAPTFVPLTSAKGTDGPSGSTLFGSVPSPFSEANWAENVYNAVSDNPPILPLAVMRSALDNTMTCGTVFVPVTPILSK